MSYSIKQGGALSNVKGCVEALEQDAENDENVRKQLENITMFYQDFKENFEKIGIITEGETEEDFEVVIEYLGEETTFYVKTESFEIRDKEFFSQHLQIRRKKHDKDTRIKFNSTNYRDMLNEKEPRKLVEEVIESFLSHEDEILNKLKDVAKIMERGDFRDSVRNIGDKFGKLQKNLMKIEDLSEEAN